MAAIRNLVTHRSTTMLLAVVIMFTLVLAAVQPVLAGTIPTFSIVSVVTDTSVTIRTNSFPAGMNFTVRMGEYGTLGIGGTVVATTASGTGGSFNATYAIPAALVGKAKIAIRMEGTGGYYSFNWFYNNSSASPVPTPVPPIPGYSGYPTFSISAVEKDVKVTVLTHNLPPSQTVKVRIGEYGTLGIGGTLVDTFDSGTGGAKTLTFTIPAALHGRDRLAIRMDCTLGFYAFNWFWNASTSGAPVPTPVPPIPGYTGIPTFSISAVVKDVKVTVLTHNLPPSQTFKVRMGEYGTLGIGGTVVDTIDSGAGGAQTLTFTIPAALHGRSKIAIRMDTTVGYYAFNWFWNNTTP